MWKLLSGPSTAHFFQRIHWFCFIYLWWYLCYTIVWETGDVEACFTTRHDSELFIIKSDYLKSFRCKKLSTTFSLLLYQFLQDTLFSALACEHLVSGNVKRSLRSWLTIPPVKSSSRIKQSSPQRFPCWFFLSSGWLSLRACTYTGYHQNMGKA